ncbi:TetR family transcriptional regulator [Prauserella sp. PE36]|uniref:TetR/AcrR family transcriptional regulator n=1 Tax=Prauserella sp. PE36 TaxID=1504709 RepID=UPI000D94C527|nr:TetR/AcrR family transcriptional regulator [Prauserella sp. PE36]PXY20391.1 hypothetical protein BAY59_31645 [Prauserella coralliicola]RBM22495.1 TetR family transcriptional regulator [Prauserella sp. PE36]
MTGDGLRERKKQQTRAALSEAATRLFLEKGYQSTTVAEIAAEAGVSTKTLFNYFSGKEDVLFAHRRQRIDEMERVLAEQVRATGPAEALHRTAECVLAWIGTGDGPGLEPNATQARLIMSVPELRSRLLSLLWELERRLATVLHEAYPRQLDLVTAAAAVGALVGGMHAAARACLDRGDPVEALVPAAERGIAVAMRGLEDVVAQLR